MKFEEWKEKNIVGEVPDEVEYIMRRAWNAALDQIKQGTEIHDTLGDIKEMVERLECEEEDPDSP